PSIGSHVPSSTVMGPNKSILEHPGVLYVLILSGMHVVFIGGAHVHIGVPTSVADVTIRSMAHPVGHGTPLPSGPVPGARMTYSASSTRSMHIPPGQAGPLPPVPPAAEAPAE